MTCVPQHRAKAARVGAGLLILLLRNSAAEIALKRDLLGNVLTGD